MNLLSKVLKFSKKFLSPALGLLAFYYIAVHAWSYFTSIQSADQEIHISSSLYSLIGLSLFFYGLNWLAEAFKWKIALRHALNMSIGLAIKSVFKGITYGIATPNRLGEFAGRVTVLPFEFRKYAVGKHLVLSISQSFVTLFWGVMALIMSPFLHINEMLQTFVTAVSQHILLTFFAIFLLLFILSFVINASWFKIHFIARIKKIIPSFKEFLSYLWISQVRYIAFMAQYLLLLAIFDISVSYVLFWQLSIMLLLITYIPSTFLTQLGIRGSVALFCLSPFGINPVTILLVTSILWFLNAAIPALLGASIKGQLFRKTQVA